jgi:GTP-binding protein Era
MTRSGFVALAGRPNAGKSTLLNRLVGQRLAITSPKAQSTRERVVGILSDDSSQIVLLDTPGLLDPQDALHQTMKSAAHRAIADADVVLHLMDARDEATRSLWEEAGWTGAQPRATVIPVRTKADLLDPIARARLAATEGATALISARTGDGIAELLDRVRGALPESPFLYPADDVSTQSVRFFVAELIRETALEQLDEEVPHALACAIEEFRETRTPVYIRAVLYVERESQKRIVIGSGGAQVREIGRRARAKVESLVGAQVFLDLWVKVLPNWRRDEAALRRLGYSTADSVR